MENESKTAQPHERVTKRPDATDRVAKLLNRSLHKIISEEDFIEPLKKNALPLFRLAAIISFAPGNLSARFYFNLMNESHTLETFLDNYGTRTNQTWHYFTELIASIRNFAIAAFHLSHVLNRYADYQPDESQESSKEFILHGLEVTEFINEIEKDLITEALAELKRRGCDLAAEEITPGPFKDIDKNEKLPRNLTTDYYKTTEQRIMRVVETYRKLAIKIHRDRYDRRLPPEEFAKLIPSRVNETKVKILENTLHTIQSEYDTHIHKTDIESRDADLISLRSYISIPLHLLEMARWLIHFYERHENEIHTDESREKISRIVDKNLVLKLISQFAFFYAHKQVTAGKTIAEKVMSKRVRKARIKAPIPQPAGFHARPAYYITLVVEEHGTDIFMWVGDRKFDARSVLDLLEGGGMVADMELEEVEFEGDDRTLKDLKVLAEHNYCENDQVPKQLNYIRIARNIAP